MKDDKRKRELETDRLYREHLAQMVKKNRERDEANANAGRVYASDFARERGISAWVLRKKMRRAGYKRKGRNLIPIKDLEKFVE